MADFKPLFFQFARDPKREPVLVDYVRTPIGKRRGKMVRIRADDMLVLCIRRLVERTKLEETGRVVDDVVVGCNSQIGECALDVARTAALAAGLDYRTPGTTVNRQCASGMQAVMFAWQQIATCQHDVVIAGGVEGQNKYAIGSDMIVDGVQYPPNRKIVKNPSLVRASKEAAQKGGKFGPRLAQLAGQIQAAELMGWVWGAEREELDRLSLRSHEKACDPANAEKRQKEMFPVEVPKLDENGKPILDDAGQMVPGETETCDQDESPRPNTNLEIMAKLRPIVLRRSGLLTAGNSCPTSDGAAATMWMARGVAEELGMPIRATLVGCAVVGTDPILMLTGPIEATPRVLKQVGGASLDDVDFIEINEAFSTVVYASCKELGLDWDDPRLNQWGGAIALGHPTGMTGCRLIGTLVHQLEDAQKAYGLGTLCVGWGMGIAGVVKREGA
ncbi:MAG: acetyl-CoA C-acetyltransferase [Promethearchaeota archaeon]